MEYGIKQIIILDLSFDGSSSSDQVPLAPLTPSQCLPLHHCPGPTPEESSVLKSQEEEFCILTVHPSSQDPMVP